VHPLLRWVKRLLVGAAKPPVLEEARFPRDASGRPDLTRFTRPVSHYVGYVDAYLASLGDTPLTDSDGLTPARDYSAWQAHAYTKGVFGQWGLIARGPAEALPYVLTLLTQALPEARQTAAGVLGAWMTPESRDILADHALRAAEREAAMPAPDAETLSTLLGLLGRVRALTALPLIAQVLRAPSSRDGDVDYAAAEAVEAISGARFDQSVDPRQAAERWLRDRGH